MFNSIKRDQKIRCLVKNLELKRLGYKYLINCFFLDKSIRNLYIYKLNDLSRNTSKTRLKNRCVISGRSRSVLNFCKLSRICLRELANNGLVSGIVKSSW